MDGLLLKKAFCCSLESFGLVVGFIQWGISAFLGVVFLICLVLARFEPEIFEEYDISGNGASIVTISLVCLLTSGMLVYGIKRERHQFMFPWLILNVINLPTFIFMGVFMFFYFLSIPGKESAFLSFSCLIFLAVQALFVYITLAIYSLYYQIKESSKRLQNSA